MIRYRPIASEDFAAVTVLANIIHGDNYLTSERLADWIQKGIDGQLNASFLAELDGQVIAYRITYLNQNWQADKWCTPQQWPASVEQASYFKSIGVLAEYQGRGVGSQLMKRSIAAAKQHGARIGVAHVWMASPGNSAVKYFTKLGGQLIAEHPAKWQQSCLDEGYVCPICGPLCQCVAGEMILPL